MTMAHDGSSEEILGADAEMYRHMASSYPEAGVMDESGREMAELSWEEKLDIAGSWLRRHPESAAAWRMARFGSPVPRKRSAGSADDRASTTGAAGKVGNVDFERSRRDGEEMEDQAETGTVARTAT